MMESAIPPSYSEATNRDHWTLVAEYIASSDLCAASLVSRRWHKIFASCLWGNPAGHFGTENDRVYIALTRFKRSLPTARLQVRQLTHTLRLPPALSEIHDGPKAEWLRDILEQLPNLQSLIVSRLPFFDHVSLLALRQPSSNRALLDTNAADSVLLFPLRLLIATRCDNATSAGLAEACLHWQNLVFLDLSNTTAARDNAVLSTFHCMKGLQVLKLQNVALRDDDLEVLANAIQLRVRSLDISDNRLTDLSVRTLLSKCFHVTKDVQAERMRTGERESAEEDWPSGAPRPDAHAWNEFRGDDLDERLLRSFTKSVVGRILIEELPRPGITHLWIRNNFITVEGVASLLRSENLHVLDAATVDMSKALGRPRARSSVSQPLNFALPGTEMLTSVLERYAEKNLTFLRLHHAVVTEPSGHKDDTLSPVELSGNGFRSQIAEVDAYEPERHELGPIELHRSELVSPTPVYELDASPRYELAAEPVEAVVSSPRRQKLCATRDTLLRNEGPAFAPEVVTSAIDKPVVLTATGLSLSTLLRSSHPENRREEQQVSTTPGHGIPYPLKPPSPLGHGRDDNIIMSHFLPESQQGVSSNSRDVGVSEDSVATQIAKIVGRRQNLRHGIRDPSRGLLPGRLPSLRTLVLTEVPSHEDASGTVVSALKKFISDCALEVHLALQQTSLEYPSLYIRGRPRSMHQSHRCHEFFALRTIVLEMAPEQHFAGPPHSHFHHRTNSEIVGSTLRTPTSPNFQHGGWSLQQQQQQRSSTEDADADLFWKAQENDFSFFEEEECGLPIREPGRHIPRSSLEQKMVISAPEELQRDDLVPSNTVGLGDGGVPPFSQRPISQFGPQEGGGESGGGNVTIWKDVVAELARWRRERKKLAESQGKNGQFVEGYWPGEIKIVRYGASKQRGFTDWYGNYFNDGVYR